MAASFLVVTQKIVHGREVVATKGQTVTRATFRDTMKDAQFEQLIEGGAIRPYDVPEPAVPPVAAAPPRGRKEG